MSPAILFCDEIEKALSGAGGQGDSGVATRLFGTFLTYLSDRTSDAFVIGTCNNISQLPPEFTALNAGTACSFSTCPPVPRRTSSGNSIAVCSALSIRRTVPTTPRGRERRFRLLPAGHAAGCHSDPGRPPRCSRGRHGGRAGGQAAFVGQRPLFVRLDPGIYQRDGEPPTRPGRRVQRGPNNN